MLFIFFFKINAYRRYFSFSVFGKNSNIIRYLFCKNINMVVSDSKRKFWLNSPPLYGIRIVMLLKVLAAAPLTYTSSIFKGVKRGQKIA